MTPPYDGGGKGRRDAYTAAMTTPVPARLLLPPAPVLATRARAAAWLSTDGEIETISLAEAAARAQAEAPMLCHRPATVARLGVAPFPAYDVLELFAFTRPARFCLPTVRGLAEALDLPRPRDLEDEPEALLAAVRSLLNDMVLAATRLPAAKLADSRAIAWRMARGEWGWGPAVLAALGVQGDSRGGRLDVWDRLPEWSEHAPEAPPGSIAVEAAETRQRLADLLGPDAEQRPSQADYASAAALAFRPRDAVGAPNMVLAEAGTGTGKTLGYIAPASLWAEKNGGAVWVSTFTRNLQRQLDGELDRLFPDPAVKARKVVVRKGRENYVCLLNYEEMVKRLDGRSTEAVAAGLVARWLLATRDGDMAGGDLPGWLGDLVGRGRLLALADRRGECIFSACPHFRRCFIERAVRRARRADIVVANHALVMVQAAMGGLDDDTLPTRYVFDEGHHLFDAADSAFSAHLSGFEAAELRRWLLGAEGDGARSRARGLKRRVEDLVGASDTAVRALDQALEGSRALPGPGWHVRLIEGTGQGACECFLTLVRDQVRARSGDPDSPYGLEAEPDPPIPGLPEAAVALDRALERLVVPLRTLATALASMLDDQAAELDSNTRQRIDSVCRGIERRALMPLAAWRDMLGGLGGRHPKFVDWFGIERVGGRDLDVGFHRHWRDPTEPFARTLAEPAHGLLVTSATLRDGSGVVERDWEAAERRTGALHLPLPAVRATVPSPFDYPAQTRVLVVTDVRKDDLAQVAAAYRELFLAAGGGGLGLFTAVSRLKAVYQRIAGPLDHAGLQLLAQHVDALDTATLVDIFRAEEDSCLLGTDAVRDGVDVPGRSLRLIVFDRVPWPRPDILHKARRAEFGGRAYDDMITRLRLKQAFGRLVRRAGDRGVFVLLDPMMPTRLAGAFPPGVAVDRVGLAEAVRRTAEFLAG